MKDPSLSRRRRPNPPKKLKLVCSFNGAFRPRPPLGSLRYTGGETRIVTVDRAIGFSLLKSKVSEFLIHCPNSALCFSLKYQLPIENDDSPVVLIASDDDVRCMIDAYEKLESLGKQTRLWIYVCNDSIDETESLKCGFGVSWENNDEFGGDCVKSVSDSVNGFVFESRNLKTHVGGRELNGDGVKNPVMGVSGVQCSVDSLRRLVVKQQFLDKQSDQFRRFRGGLGLDYEQTEMGSTCGNQKYDRPLKHLTSEPQGPVRDETRELKFSGNTFRANVFDYEFRNDQLQRSDNSGINPFHVSNSYALNPRDGNPLVETNIFMQCVTNRCDLVSSNGTASGPGGYSVSCLDRENRTPSLANCDLVRTSFAPLSCTNQLAGNLYPSKPSYGTERVWGSLNNSIRNHRVFAIDTRNQRNCPYHVRNHQNSLLEMGNHRNVRLEGRPWMGKLYPGVRSCSNISKQGQGVRLSYPSLWNPWLGCPGNTAEGLGRMMGSGMNDQTYSFDQSYGAKGNFTNDGGLEVPLLQEIDTRQYRFGCNEAYTGMGDQSLLPTNLTNDPLRSTRAMSAQEDLLTGSIGEKHEVSGVTMRSQPNSIDFAKESHFMESMETIDISGSTNNKGFESGMGLECYSKFPNIESNVKPFSKDRRNSHDIQGGLDSLVDLSLCTLSLSSSKEIELPGHSSACNDVSEASVKPQSRPLDLMDEEQPSYGSPDAACNDVSEALVKPQSRPLDLMDEEQLSSGSPDEISTGVVSDPSFHTTAKVEKVDEQKELTWQDYPSKLSIDKKAQHADVKESEKCPKANGTIPCDLAPFYTHLASPELQKIKNSNLEYVKELGSGAYGTVFYGKWKGSDVAIKKLKPSCFTENAPDQDRLVADFWKEAHLLGQLHHPHIVAFYGVVTDGPVTNLATVTEYMVNGSLKQVLQKKDRTIDRRKRLIIAMDAAFGMEYLHEKNIVHFDLKSHNFLVNMRDPQRPVCKIGDLGLSKIKQRTLVSGGIRGTIPWMAPELLNSKNKMVTEKVDVYSFGIVMWELLTGEEPYGDMRSQEIIAGIMKGNLRPEIPSWCDPVWRSLMERCWSSDPDARPAFLEIAKELRAMSAAMNIK